MGTERENGNECKTRLRKDVIAARQELTPAYVRESDRRMAKHLVSLPEFQQAETVFVFISMDGEVDTSAIIEQALEAGKVVAAPRVRSLGRMDAYRIRGFEDLDPPNRWGIREPKTECSKILPQDIDFAVLPCVSLSRTGKRLGYGGGFYDRYLREMREGVCAAGLCRERLLREDIPEEAHDVRIPVVITEDGVFRIGCQKTLL